MIEIEYTDLSDYIRIKMDGHAGYDEHGKDIVCASCSALISAFEGWLENSIEYMVTISNIMKDGYALIEVRGGAVLHEVFHMLMIGLMGIEASYPNNVRITEITDFI